MVVKEKVMKTCEVPGDDIVPNNDLKEDQQKWADRQEEMNAEIDVDNGLYRVDCCGKLYCCKHLIKSDESHKINKQVMA